MSVTASTIANWHRPDHDRRIGGGPAGLEAARVCAERSHQVTLFEAQSKLGGQVRLLALSRRRREIISVIDWREAELVRLGVPATGRWKGISLYRIGDAVASRNIHAAIYDALRLCKDL